MNRVIAAFKGLIVMLIISLPLAASASSGNSVMESADQLFHAIKFWLCVAPQICDLLLILVSVFLMLDGVRRWGSNRSGAFSRTLIGLFILHSSSLEVPYVPYVALTLEVALAVRSVHARHLKEADKSKFAYTIKATPQGS
jgi:hypothetical protein